MLAALPARPMYQIAKPLRCLPWGHDSGSSPVRLAVIAREDAPGVLEPVVLRLFAGGRVHLAALVDHELSVVEWLELWVQSPHELAASPAARCGLLGNGLLDRRWDAAVAALRELDPGAVLETPWDAAAPGAWAIDPTAGAIVRLVHRETGRPLELCRDETALQAAGRTGYQATLAREFRVTTADGRTVWLKQTEFSALDANTPVQSESGKPGPLLEFNTAAGLMLLRRYRPVSLEGFADWLRAGAKAAADGTDVDPVHQIERGELDAHVQRSAADRFFADDPVVETAFLRLQLWLGAVTAAHTACRRTNTPFFNLSSESFRVAWARRAAAVPAPWLFEVALVQPGDAVPLAGAEGAPAQFVPSGLNPASPYAVARFGGWREGSGTVRLTQVVESAGGRVRLDGFIDGNDLRAASADESPAVWLQLQLDAQPVSFLATLEPEQGGVRAGVRFKAVDVALPAGTAARLKSAATPRRPCHFTLLRPVHPAYDVHGLGTVGVRIFLAATADEVPDLVEDLFELAALLPHQCSLEEIGKLAATPDINERLRRLLALPSWAAPSAGSGGLPLELWHAIVRELMEFTAVEELEQPADDGIGSPTPVPTPGPEWLGMLSRRLVALERLTVHTRGLLTAPRTSHEEIARVIHRFVRSGKLAAE